VGQYEDETPTGKFTNPQEKYRMERAKYLNDLSMITTTGEYFTVVYFMPYGEALIRYQATGKDNPYMMDQCFAAAKVIAGTGTEAPRLEWLKFRGDSSEMFRALARIVTEDN
jgi:hypothetical protein